jgi:mediator of RNA polymerase II transcription subunit 17
MVQPNMPALSSVRSSERNCEELPVETLLLRARDSIYDEELYHELHREARNLTNQGVRSNDGMVSIPYDHNKRIEIDLLSCLPDECVESESNTCAGIAISLRILLSHAHRQNLRRRSQPPPPVREGKIPRPTYAIITPVLEHLQHDLQVKSTVQLLSDLRATCMRAGFDLRFHNPTPPYGLENLAAEAAPSDFHATEGLINQLTKLRQSTIVILLPTGLTELQVGMQTSLQPHLCGTGYQCTIVSSALESYISRMPSTIQFPSFAALEGHVLHLLQLDIVGLVASRQDGINGWTIVSPHDGQASRANRNTERSDRIWITVQRNSIRLKWKRGHKRRNDEGTVKWDSRTPTAVDADNSPSLIATIDDIFGDGI